jgi:hypothetical protein
LTRPQDFRATAVFFGPAGDYRLAKYLYQGERKIPDAVFK